MTEVSVTIFWMAGVVAMMLVFGVIALVGVHRSKRRGLHERQG